MPVSASFRCNADSARHAIAAAKFHCLACVNESERATDLALAIQPARLVVIRCVDRVCAADCAALATMLIEGDFVWAGIIFSEWEGSKPVGPIEAFHVSELDRLVTRLTKLREAFDGPT